jgi:hypothetical protein
MLALKILNRHIKKYSCNYMGGNCTFSQQCCGWRVDKAEADGLGFPWMYWWGERNDLALCHLDYAKFTQAKDGGHLAWAPQHAEGPILPVIFGTCTVFDRATPCACPDALVNGSPLCAPASLLCALIYPCHFCWLLSSGLHHRVCKHSHFSLLVFLLSLLVFPFSELLGV